MRRRWRCGLAVAVVATGLGAVEAEATSVFGVETCTSFNVCLDFDLVRTGGPDASGFYSYQLTIAYTASPAVATSGSVTNFGMWDRAGMTNYQFKDLALVDGTGSWTFDTTSPHADCGGLAAPEFSSSLFFEACANEADGGLQLGTWVTISFKATPDLTTTAFNGGAYGSAGYIQGFGDGSCDVRLITTSGHDESGVTQDCLASPATVTPEPISMVLMGSGLLGLGVARRRRRIPAELEGE